MADNLTVSIGIDTAKLKADTELAKAEMRKLGADLKKQADAALKGNKDARLQVDELSKAYTGLSRTIAINTRVLQEQNRAVVGHGVAAVAAAKGMGALTRAHKEFAEGTKANTKEVFALSREFGKMEVSGFGIAKAFREIPKIAIPIAVVTGVAAVTKKTADEAKDLILSLDRLSKVSGFAARDVAGVEHYARSLGVDAKVADQFIAKLGESLDKIQAKKFDMGQLLGVSGVMRGAAGTAGIGGPQVFRGPGALAGPGMPTQAGAAFFSGFAPSGVFVQRGAAQMDPERMRQGLTGLVDASAFNLDIQDQRNRYLVQVHRVFQQLAAGAPSMARELLRASGAEDIPGTMKLLTAGQTPEARAEVERLALTDPRLRRRDEAEEYERQQQLKAGRTERAEVQGAALRTVSTGVELFGKAIEGLGNLIESERPKWQADLGSFVKDVTGALDSVANAARNFKNDIPLGSQEGQVIPLAKAAGGLIPGSGGGDTVPAWLTPGEYVAKRASVAYYGSGLFSALNNMALPRGMFSSVGYATGGLVGDLGGAIAESQGNSSARGGTAFNIVLDGTHFAARSDDAVASALVTAARRQQMRSAGRKPSWFGAPPGG